MLFDREETWETMEWDKVCSEIQMLLKWSLGFLAVRLLSVVLFRVFAVYILSVDVLVSCGSYENKVLFWT